MIEPLLGKFALGKEVRDRRWCPECYRCWDDDTMYEPLLWDISILSDCPVHLCAMEDSCRNCGARQRMETPYEKRRVCRQCGVTLGLPGKFTKRFAYHRWVDRQVCEVIEFCSAPDARQVSPDVYRAYLNGLALQQVGNNSIPASVKYMTKEQRANNFKGRKTSLRSMVNMCSLQAVSVVEMLHDPQAAASKCLLNLWGNYGELPMTSGAHTRKAFAFHVTARVLLRECRGKYLPPAELFLRAINLNEDLARELHPSIYAKYQEAYFAQGTQTQLIHRRRALTAALQVISRCSSHLRGFGISNLANEVSRESAVTRADALVALTSAIALRRAMRRVERLTKQPSIEALENPIWTRTPAPESEQ